MLTKTKPPTKSELAGWYKTKRSDVEAIPTPVSNGEAIHEEEIPLSAIADSPWQRRVKTGDDLKDVKTIATVGLLHAVTLRPKGDGYELVCGHRRCAAARALGWKTIRARVCHVDDARAQEILMIENADREGLSAIEEAREYEDWLRLHPGSTQVELAALMKVSQGHVANRIRMLKMPAIWQEAIISGEIPSTYSRAILPYCDDPRAAAAIAKVRKKVAPAKGGGRPLDYADLCGELAGAFLQAGLGLGYHSEHDKKSGHWISLPQKLTEDQRRRLDILSVKGEGRHGERRMEIALNRSAWFEIAREQRRREEERRANRGNGMKKKSDKPREEMTPAERKEAAAEAARNKKKRQEQLERRQREIAADWKRLLIAKALADPAQTGKEVLMACMICMTDDWRMERAGYMEIGDRQDALEEVTGHKGDLLECLALGGIDAPILWDIARAYARRAFADGGDNPASTIVRNRDLDLMVAWLKIDLETAWATEQMGSLSQAWWEAHDKDDLVRIGSGIVNSSMKKGELVGTLARSGGIKMPAALRPKAIAAAKRAPKPR